MISSYLEEKLRLGMGHCLFQMLNVEEQPSLQIMVVFLDHLAGGMSAQKRSRFFQLICHPLVYQWLIIGTRKADTDFPQPWSRKQKESLFIHTFKLRSRLRSEFKDPRAVIKGHKILM
jgi:hypothetical protein